MVETEEEEEGVGVDRESGVVAGALDLKAGVTAAEGGSVTELVRRRRQGRARLGFPLFSGRRRRRRELGAELRRCGGKGKGKGEDGEKTMETHREI